MNHNTSQSAAAGAPRSPTNGPDLYPEITGPLTARGLETYVQQVQSVWLIRVPLPHQRNLVITRPREAGTPFPPGPPTAWRVVLHRDAPTREQREHEVLYDSHRGGSHYSHHGDIGAMLAVVDRQLDYLDIPHRPQTSHRARSGEPKPTPAQVRALAAIRDGDVRLRRIHQMNLAFLVTAPGVSITTIDVCRARHWVSVDISGTLTRAGQRLSLTPTGAAVLAAAEQAGRTGRGSPARARTATPHPAPLKAAVSPAPVPPAGQSPHR